MDRVNTKLDTIHGVQKNWDNEPKSQIISSGHIGHSSFIEKVIRNKIRNKINHSKTVGNKKNIYKENIGKITVSTVSKVTQSTENKALTLDAVKKLPCPTMSSMTQTIVDKAVISNNPLNTKNSIIVNSDQIFQDKNHPLRSYIFYTTAKELELQIGSQFKDEKENEYTVESYINRRQDTNRYFKGFRVINPTANGKQSDPRFTSQKFRNTVRKVLIYLGENPTFQSFKKFDKDHGSETPIDWLTMVRNIEAVGDGLTEIPHDPEKIAKQVEWAIEYNKKVEKK